jgi:hypothetical protein
VLTPSKAGKVALPELARGVLDRYLARRVRPVTPAKWNPATPLLGSLDGEAGITSERLWAVVKRFFATTADVLANTNPTLAGGRPASTAGYAGTNACEGAAALRPRPRSAAQERSVGLPLAGTLSELGLSGNLHP